MLLAAAVAVGGSAGCAGPARFPDGPLAEKSTEAGFVRAYDTDGDDRADFFATLGDDGHVTRIGYDTTGSASEDVSINLDALRLCDCRHVVLILDGVPLHMVKRYWDEGGLRMFHAPSLVLAPYPSMTDLALSDLFRSVRCLGYEALYFDHRANRLAGGDDYYLAMKNESWTHDLDYRAGTTLDALGYLYPNWAFGKELEDFDRLLGRRDRRTFIAYFVSTAGIGSREGEAGLKRVLERVDRLVYELVWQTRGLVKVTMLADHGHTLKRCERVDFGTFLRERGWRVTDRLVEPRDVAPVEYGLVTYASFATRDRKALAGALLEHEGVEFVAYAEGDTVVAEGREGRAVIERRPSRYRCTTSGTDPLGLGPIVARLSAEGRADADGFVADRALFEATATHCYPDACDRLWRAFNGLAEHVPDVVANLHAGHCAGAASKMSWLPYMASTHGDLGRDSSGTFIMSTIAPFPPALRTREVGAVLESLTKQPWPPAREGRR